MRCSDGPEMSRRAFGAGAILAATRLLGGSDAAVAKPPAAVERGTGSFRKLIWVQMCGGAAGIDTFDPKEAAGQSMPMFRPIETSQTGVRVTELFPRMAQVMHLGALFRARLTAATEHLPALKHQLAVGVDGTNFLIRHDQRMARSRVVYLESPEVIKGFDYRGEAYLVPRTLEIRWNADLRTYPEPAVFTPDPDTDADGTLERIEDRRALLGGLDRMRLPEAQGRRHDETRDTAHELIRRAAEAAEDAEDDVAERYAPEGSGAPAMGILTTREVIRRGFFRVAVIRMGGDEDGWDTHNNLKRRTRNVARAFDRPVAELIKDVMDGQLGDTTLVIDTELGRTPWHRRSYFGGQGREHFPWHCSMLFSPNVEGGVVIGSTDRDGHGVGGQRQGVVDDDLWLKAVGEALTVDPRRGDDALRRAVPVFRRPS